MVLFGSADVLGDCVYDSRLYVLYLAASGERNEPSVLRKRIILCNL